MSSQADMLIELLKVKGFDNCRSNWKMITIFAGVSITTIFEIFIELFHSHFRLLTYAISVKNPMVEVILQNSM